MNELERTLSDICHVFGVKVEDIKGKRRIQLFVAIRHMFYYETKNSGYAPAEIAKVINQDRCSTYAGIKAAADRFKYDLYFKHKYEIYNNKKLNKKWKNQ